MEPYGSPKKKNTISPFIATVSLLLLSLFIFITIVLATAIIVIVTILLFEGSLELKLPTIWRDGNAEVGSVRDEKRRREKIRERVRRKKMQVREKVGKSRFTMFFQWFVAPEGQKVGSLKRRPRSHLARWEMKSCTPHCGAKHVSKSKVLKTDGLRPLLEIEMLKKCALFCRERISKSNVQDTATSDRFGSWDVEKVHAVVARSTFPSRIYKAHQVRTTFGSWDVEKCKKHYMLGPLLRVQMSFGVAGARDCAPCQKWGKREGFVAALTTSTTLHFTTLHYTKLQLHYYNYNCNKNYITQHYTTIHYTTLHYTNDSTVQSSSLNSTSHYTDLHYTPLHSTSLHYITSNTTLTTTPTRSTRFDTRPSTPAQPTTCIYCQHQTWPLNLFHTVIHIIFHTAPIWDKRLERNYTVTCWGKTTNGRQTG